MSWLKARQATIVVNAISHDWQEFSYDENYGEFDCTAITGNTNAAGALAEDFDVDVVSTPIKGSYIVDSVTLKTLKGGRKFAASYTDAAGEVHSGNVILLTRGKAVATKGGYKQSVSGKFAGGATGQ